MSILQFLARNVRFGETPKVRAGLAYASTARGGYNSSARQSLALPAYINLSAFFDKLKTISEIGYRIPENASQG